MTRDPQPPWNRPLTLMAVLAHPDDESLGTGGTLAKYASEGVNVHLVTATLGERGWKGAKEDYPGPAAVGEHREAELRAASEALGVRELSLLGYMDGDLDQVPPERAAAAIAERIVAARPDVVVTFGPDGAYGHPDHIAISQFTTAAIVKAASGAGLPAAHQVSKLYYMAPTKDELAAYQAAFGDLKKRVGEVERRFTGWDDWAVTTRLDTTGHVESVWRAVSSHRSQLRDFEKLMNLPEAERTHIFGQQTFYRAFSQVAAGEDPETDLFAGLRSARSSSRDGSEG